MKIIQYKFIQHSSTRYAIKGVKGGYKSCAYSKIDQNNPYRKVVQVGSEGSRNKRRDEEEAFGGEPEETKEEGNGEIKRIEGRNERKKVKQDKKKRRKHEKEEVRRKLKIRKRGRKQWESAI